MKHEFIAGDHVEWNSEGGYVRGTIMKQVTSAAERKISTARHAPGRQFQRIPRRVSPLDQALRRLNA